MSREPDPTDEDWQRRHALLFPSDLPTAAVGGVEVYRSTLFYSEDGPADEDLDWSIAGWPSGSDKCPFTLMGDLRCRQLGWFAGVSVVAHLSFAEPLELDDDDMETINSLARKLGGWATNVLYDTAALVARQQIAANPGCDMEIPRLTPHPRFGTVTLVEQQAAEDVSHTDDAQI